MKTIKLKYYMLSLSLSLSELMVGEILRVNIGEKEKKKAKLVFQ